MTLNHLRLKQFIKDYNLPLQTTAVFIAVILVLLFIRNHERSILADVLASQTNGGQDYAALLSNDKVDDLKKNEVAENEQLSSPTSSAGGDTSTPFTVTPNSTSPTTTATTTTTSTTTTTQEPTTPPSGGTTTTQPAPFSASIVQFRHENTSPLQCPTGGSGGSGQGNGTQNCYKIYYFSATVKTINGPGNVGYGWESNVDWGDGSGNFAVGSGETFTPLIKQVPMPCTQTTPLKLQLYLVSPNQASSETLTITHSC